MEGKKGKVHVKQLAKAQIGGRGLKHYKSIMKELSVKQEILRTSVERLVVGQFLGSVWHLDALWKKSVCSSPSTQSRLLAVQTLPNGKIY